MLSSAFDLTIEAVNYVVWIVRNIQTGKFNIGL
nr:Uncharacterised protein [Streptococcus thermophilus]